MQTVFPAVYMWLFPAVLYVLHESKLSYVSRVEFIRPKLMFLSAHVAGIGTRQCAPPPPSLIILCLGTFRAKLIPPASPRPARVGAGGRGRGDEVRTGGGGGLGELSGPEMLTDTATNWTADGLKTVFSRERCDPGYMSRKIIKFRTDKFDTFNKRKF